MSVKSFLTVLLLGACFAAKAQRARSADTVLKGSTIEVIQSYKPKVKQSPKPEWIPQLPPADTSHPAFNYDVPQQILNYSYNSQPLRPLELGKNPEPLPFQNYIKAGGGNLSTIFLDAGIGGIHGKDYETGIHLHHLSQQGAIANQQSSLSGIEAEGMLHRSASDWHASIAGERNQYYYYGYDHALHDYAADSVKQTYTTVRAVVDMQNKGDSSAWLFYHPAISASLYNARYNTNEINMGFDVPVTCKVDSTLDLLIGLNGSIVNYKADTTNINNNFIQLVPGVAVHGGTLSGHAMAGIALGRNSSIYVLPDVVGTYSARNDKFMMSLGYLSTLRQNTFEQLSTENPYMVTNYAVQQSRRNEVFLNMQGSGGDHFVYSGRISHWGFDNLATFLNDTGDQKQFYVKYVNTKAWSLKLGFRYVMADVWSAGINGEFYKFYNISDQYVWHEPSARIKGDVMVCPVPKFTAAAYVAVLGGIHARNSALNDVTLKPFADVGVNAEYLVVPRLSVFIQVDNLLNNKYERWLGYEAYGFNIYGGLRLKF